MIPRNNNNYLAIPLPYPSLYLQRTQEAHTHTNLITCDLIVKYGCGIKVYGTGAMYVYDQPLTESERKRKWKYT